MSISRHEFGRRVGCDFTTASRLMSGDRAPSTKLLNSICKEFSLDVGEAMRALDQDQTKGKGTYDHFARWLTGELDVDIVEDPDAGHGELLAQEATP